MTDPFRDLIDEYLDDALDAPMRERVADHILECAECRAEVGEYRRLRRLALATPPVEIPDDLSFRIRRRVNDQIRSTQESRRKWFRSPVVWATAAAAVILLALWIQPPVRAPDHLDRATSPADHLDRAPASAPVAAVGLRPVLRDWLDQAANTGPGEAGGLAAEARELELLPRVREALATARGADRRFLRSVADVLVQLQNDPSSGGLSSEAALVAKSR